MVSFLLLFIRNLKILVEKSTKFSFLAFIVSNLDKSFIIIYKLFKFSVVIFDIITKRNLSQIFDLGPSYFFNVI